MRSPVSTITTSPGTTSRAGINNRRPSRMTSTVTWTGQLVLDSARSTVLLPEAQQAAEQHDGQDDRRVRRLAEHGRDQRGDTRISVIG